jgi:hypothetical protein
MLIFVLCLAKKPYSPSQQFDRQGHGVIDCVGRKKEKLELLIKGVGTWEGTLVTSIHHMRLLSGWHGFL